MGKKEWKVAKGGVRETIAPEGGIKRARLQSTGPGYFDLHGLVFECTGCAQGYTTITISIRAQCASFLNNRHVLF